MTILMRMKMQKVGVEFFLYYAPADADNSKIIKDVH